MQAKKYIHFLAILVLVALLIPICEAATIRGSIYDHSYDAIRKSVVQINSTPVQTKVANYGGYYFVVPPGSYELTAELTQNGITRQIAQEFIVIENDGDYTRDLLLFEDFDMNVEFDVSWMSRLRRFVSDNNTNIMLALLCLVTVSIVVLTIRWWRKNMLSKPQGSVPIVTVHEIDTTEHEVTNHVQVVDAPKEPTPAVALPIAQDPAKSADDVLIGRIVTVLTKAGGSLSQKDIRKEFNVSEAKISMIMSQMTERGLVKKTKKGRTNVVQLIASA
ncbi:MAG TPA: hypothetical protein VK158_03890 [Acidobacteriota bacterium]|nr:hypothetical protein [Acidobacteriota bacterium]